MNKNKLPDSIPSHPIVPVRVAPNEKKQFISAAEKDGKKLGTWLKWLARERIQATSPES